MDGFTVKLLELKFTVVDIPINYLDVLIFTLHYHIQYSNVMTS